MSDATPRASHLIVIDPGTADWRAPAADAKLVLLDPMRDGVAAIAKSTTKSTTGPRNLAAIHRGAWPRGGRSALTE
jgi:hypothetical protein